MRIEAFRPSNSLPLLEARNYLGRSCGSVSQATYVISGHKDVSIIENYCKVNGG